MFAIIKYDLVNSYIYSCIGQLNTFQIRKAVISFKCICKEKRLY
jgi:hypothetical protein